MQVNHGEQQIKTSRKMKKMFDLINLDQPLKKDQYYRIYFEDNKVI